MTLLYILIAILLLGILVTVHEFGHFAFARLCGIEVKEYAIGFGPKLLSRQGKRGTLFSLRAIPLGGYCAFYGEDDPTGASKDDPRAWAKQSVWKRMISVLMGPGMNFLLAFVVLMCWFWLSGAPVVDPVLHSVEAGGPAEAAGLQGGDLVLAVNGADVTGSQEAFTEAIRAWQEGDEPLEITVSREEDGQRITRTAFVTPFYDQSMGIYRVGVTVGGVYRTRADGTPENRPMLLTEAVSLSWSNCLRAGSTIFNALKDLVTTGNGLENTSGPVGVVTLVTQEVREGGLDAFLNLLVVISINLGIMNLLPIPGLDGSRFLFLVLEAVRRKPIPPEKEAVVHLVGMAFLFGVMIWFTFRDVARLFTP